MRKFWKPKEPGGSGDAGDDGVGAECEAWLAGDWVEYRITRDGEGVPAWAWLNQVVHAPEKTVRVMSQPAYWTSRDDEWSRLRATVADALVRRAAEMGTTIAELQRAVLVPIELRLLSEEAPWHGIMDAELLIRILAALHHPSAQPGSR